jgi:TRAP-type transport system periplasmic protein
MMKKNLSMSRRSVLAAGAAVATATVFSRPARAAEFDLRFGNNMPQSHPLNIRASEAAEKIREETGGRVSVQMFPNNQLGADPDMLSQVRSGGIDIQTASGGGVLSQFIPITGMYNTGFAFRGYDQVWAALDGDFGNYLRKEIKKTGLHVFDKLWDNGFRQVTTSAKPVNSPDDLRGVKFRVPQTQIYFSLFQSFGVSPVSLAFADLYPALQTHLVDGQENPLSLIEFAKLYEVQKYCALTNHMWDGYYTIMNGRSWASLPPELQQIVARHLDAAAVLERQDLVAFNKDVRDKLQAKGIIFNTPDPAPFHDALGKAGYYERWRKTFGEEGWALLEQYAGKLA